MIGWLLFPSCPLASLTLDLLIPVACLQVYVLDFIAMQEVPPALKSVLKHHVRKEVPFGSSNDVDNGAEAGGLTSLQVKLVETRPGCSGFPCSASACKQAAPRLVRLTLQAFLHRAWM